MPNFKSENPGTWFPYDPDDESQGGVCLRELSTDEYEKIERLTVKTRKKFKHGAAYDDTTEDKKLASRLRWDYCIVDWKKTHLDGQEIECNTENKVKMMKVIDFVKHVVDSLSELVDANKSLEEAKAKNSESSSNGSSDQSTAPTV